MPLGIALLEEIPNNLVKCLWSFQAFCNQETFMKSNLPIGSVLIKTREKS